MYCVEHRIIEFPRSLRDSFYMNFFLYVFPSVYTSPSMPNVFHGSSECILGTLATSRMLGRLLRWRKGGNHPSIESLGRRWLETSTGRSYRRKEDEEDDGQNKIEDAWNNQLWSYYMMILHDEIDIFQELRILCSSSEQDFSGEQYAAYETATLNG